MSRLLPYKAAAAYIGMSESTLYKLTRRGEIFPDSQIPNPRGMGTPILLFSIGKSVKGNMSSRLLTMG